MLINSFLSILGIALYVWASTIFLDRALCPPKRKDGTGVKFYTAMFVSAYTFALVSMIIVLVDLFEYIANTA